MKSPTKLPLILALAFVLFSPHLTPNEFNSDQKALDEYWSETDLSSSELEALLDSKICYADRLSYLACVNSVEQMAEKFNMVLTSEHEFKPISRTDISQRLNEKAELNQWVEKWQKHQVVHAPSFLTLWKTLDKKFVKPAQRVNLIATGINGYMSVAKDPHSYIIPLDFYEEVISRSDSRINNLGFIARRSKEQAVVRKVFEGSPADKAGLRKGDHILRINSVDVAAMLPAQFSDLVKMKEGDRLGLLVERWSNEKRSEKYLEIVKSDYLTPSVNSSMINSNSSLSGVNTEGTTATESLRRVGLLILHKFAKDTCQEAKTQLRSLIEQGAQGLMLDLRDNPGGQVEEAACVLNLFIEKGTRLFETRYLDPTKKIDNYVAQNKPIYHGSLVVLINSGSASAAEIVAGTLKDLGRATLVGERTFGKGSFQDGRLWGAHTKVALFETQGMYYFPSGWTPQLVGIEPDIKVEFTDVAAHREGELFYNPLVPHDLWTGPQSLTWMQLMRCQDSLTLWQNLGEHSGEDPQVQKAKAWLNCRSSVGSIN